MKEDYTFYNCYCDDEKPINFKLYVLNELRKLNYFPWLRDEPRDLTDEKDFLNAIQRIPYLEKEIKRDQKRIEKAEEFLKRIKEHPDEEYEKYVKDETEKWQAQYNTKVNNTTDYAIERSEYLNRRADKLDFFLSKWALPAEYLSVTESLNNQLFTIRKEAEQIRKNRRSFYDNLEDGPTIASKEDYLADIKEECEDVIKRSQYWISNNRKNIKRMKKEDEATHRLFESLKEFGEV